MPLMHPVPLSCQVRRSLLYLYQGGAAVFVGAILEYK